MLDDLEEFRESLASLFEAIPVEIAVVMHARSIALSLAHPWLPLARRVAAPASRRYFAGWFARARDPRAGAERARAPGLGGGRARARRCCSRRATSTRTWCWAPTTRTSLPRSRSRASASTCAGRGSARGRPPGWRDRPRSSGPRSCAGCARAGGPSSRPRPRTRCCWAARVFTLLERRARRARGGRAGHEPAGARGARADRRGLRPPLATVERNWRDELDSLVGVGLGPRRYSPSVLAMMFFWISEVPP